MAAVETLATKQDREDRESRAFLEKTPASALTTVRLMMPVINKLRADNKDRLATSEEKIEKEIVECRYMILGDISDLDDKIERLEHNVSCMGYWEPSSPYLFRSSTLQHSREEQREWRKHKGLRRNDMRIPV